MTAIIKDWIYDSIRNIPVKHPRLFKAKIIPYAFKNGRIQLLLCRERRHDDQSELKYGLIGGGCDDNETIIETACRELYEETINVLNYSPETLARLPRQNIVRMERNYQAKKKTTVYIFFLPIHSKLADTVVADFHRNRIAIQRLYEQKPLSRDDYLDIRDSLGDKWKLRILNRRSLRCFFEIEDIRWFSRDAFVNSGLVSQFLRNRFAELRDPEAEAVFPFEVYENTLRDTYGRFLSITDTPT